jgi:ribosomal protein S14
LEYSGEREDENPVYDDCPTHCDADGKQRSTFCDSCPIGIARDQFREDATDELNRMSADNPAGSRFGFDYLYKCLVDVVNLGDLSPASETMTTRRLRSIIEGERSRIARVKKWNKRNKSDS